MKNVSTGVSVLSGKRSRRRFLRRNGRGIFPNRNFELRKVMDVDSGIGMGVAWNTEDPTAARDDIIDIARSLVRPPRQPATALSRLAFRGAAPVTSAGNTDDH
jgi:hypothetical protein